MATHSAEDNFFDDWPSDAGLSGNVSVHVNTSATGHNVTGARPPAAAAAPETATSVSEWDAWNAPPPEVVSQWSHLNHRPQELPMDNWDEIVELTNRQTEQSEQEHEAAKDGDDAFDELAEAERQAYLARLGRKLQSMHRAPVDKKLGSYLVNQLTSVAEMEERERRMAELAADDADDDNDDRDTRPMRRMDAEHTPVVDDGNAPIYIGSEFADGTVKRRPLSAICWCCCCC